jgi:hypothetical protein
MAQKSAVETTTATAVEVSRSEKLREIAAAAIAEMQATEFDSEQMMFDILEANSLDDILDSQVVHLKDIIGIPITILSAQLQESKFEDGMIPAYAVMRVEFDSGERAVVTCGASQVIAALVKAQIAGWYPFRCNTVSIKTGAGFEVIKLTKAS